MKTDQLHSFTRACFIRAFEREIAKQSDAGEVPGLVHLSTGAEVAEVALASVLDSKIDQITGSHRSHGLALAVGASPEDVAKEILGRVGGLSDGMAGTQHIMAPDAGFLTSNGIVGAQVPLAAGAALTAKTMKTGGVGVAAFGDGAANQGAVMETMNLAVALELPMIFVLFNNGMAQTTSARFASGGTSFIERARSFGLKACTVDGQNFDACVAAFESAAEAARSLTPAFAEVLITRDDGHYYGEQQPNSQNEDGAALQVFTAQLLANGFTKADCDQAKKQAQDHARAAVAEALMATKAGGQQLDEWQALSGACS